MSFSLLFRREGKVFSCEDDNWFEYSFLRNKGLDNAVERAVNDLWNPMRSCKVIEIGCGSGRFLKWLYMLGHQVTGIEVSNELVQKALKRLPEKVHILHCDATSLPFGDSQYDVVFFVFSLEFMAQPEKALMEGLRIAKDLVFIISLNPFSPILWRERLFSFANANPLLKCCPLSNYKTKRLLARHPDNVHILKDIAIWRDRPKRNVFLFDEYIAPAFLIKVAKAVQVGIKLPVPVIHKGLIASNTATFDLYMQSIKKKEVPEDERGYAL